MIGLLAMFPRVRALSSNNKDPLIFVVALLILVPMMIQHC
jgi:hypothetical protein